LTIKPSNPNQILPSGNLPENRNFSLFLTIIYYRGESGRFFADIKPIFKHYCIEKHTRIGFNITINI
jgi:hypothetical protein